MPASGDATDGLARREEESRLAIAEDGSLHVCTESGDILAFRRGVDGEVECERIA
jgi:hypothetical protein